MPLAVVQNSTAIVRATGNPLTSVLGFGSAITTGNAVFVLITQQSGSTRTFTVDDGTAAVYVKIVDFPHVSGYVSNGELWCCANHPGGTSVPSVTHNNGSADFRVSALEMSGFGGTVEVIDTDIVDESVAGNSHISSAAGLTTGRECVAIVQGSTGGSNFTNSVEGSGYTKIPASYVETTTYHAQKIFASGCTAEQGAWTHTGITRDVTSWISLLGPPMAGGGGGGVALIGSWID